MLEALTFAKIGGWIKSAFTNKYVLIAIGVLALIGGTAFAIHHHTKAAVTTAVAKADDKATIQSQSATIQTTQAAAKIDQKYDQQAVNTAKEYDHVRTVIVAAPTASVAADPLLIGTVNALAGVHGGTVSNGVSDSPD